MANYYTEASFIVPLTKEQTKFVFDVLDCVQDERIDFRECEKTTCGKSFKTAVYEAAKELALSLDGYEPENVSLGFRVEPDTNGVWISHDESIDTGPAAQLIYTVLKAFDLDICVGFEASHTCSKARTDAFGGHAAFITKENISWMSTSEWVQKMISDFNKNKIGK